MSPIELMYPDDLDGVLHQEKNKIVINAVINRWAPMNHMITMVGCNEEDDNDEDEDDDDEDDDS